MKKTREDVFEDRARAALSDAAARLRRLSAAELASIQVRLKASVENALLGSPFGSPRQGRIGRITEVYGTGARIEWGTTPWPVRWHYLRDLEIAELHWKPLVRTCEYCHRIDPGTSEGACAACGEPHK